MHQMIFFRLLSRLPFSVLYGISNVLSFLLLHVVRYRREVVLENLRLSFPEKSPADIQQIAAKFYRNFTDLIVETLKLLDISPDDLLKRIRFTNAELVRSQIEAGQAVIGMASHQANWEWLSPAAVLNGMPVDTIYKPLTNPFFEELMRQIRARMGSVLVPMHLLPRQMVASKDKARIIALGSDQVPDVPEQAYWTDFLHRDTPFYPGTEKLARRLSLPVYYLEMVRVGRGYYELTFQTVALPPYTDLPLGGIMDSYRDLIERTIRNNPSDWLWSHKRWKHWRGKYAKVGAKFV